MGSSATCLWKRSITSAGEWMGDEGMRTWWEEWTSGKADQQDPRGRLTQTQEVPLLCGMCFTITFEVVN